MTETLSFPGLGVSFELNRVAFTIGNLPVYWYGIMIATGFLLGMVYVFKRSKEFGIDIDRFIDVIVVSTIGAIIGARIYYVAFKWDYYSEHLNEVFSLRNGGIAIYGGLIGAFLVGYFMCRYKKIKVLSATDIIVGGFFIGQCIGRWGNFFNIEAFGGNTSLPWGMTSNSIASYLASHKAELEAIGMNIDPNMPVHPTFFYESLWCLIGFIIIALYTKHRKYDGELTLMYAAIYGAERFIVEGLRTDSLMWGSLRVSQVLAGICVIICIAALIVLNKKYKEGKLPPVYGTTEEAKLIVEKKFDYKTGKAKENLDSQNEDVQTNEEVDNDTNVQSDIADKSE